MATRSKWQHLATEAVNPGSRDIDTLAIDEIVDVMVLDTRAVLAAVQREKARIARGAELVADAVLTGGRADLRRRGHERQARRARGGGTSPDVRHRPDRRRRRSWPEGEPRSIERKRASKTITRQGERAMRGLRPARKDVVIGISASGITPFVRGAVSRARAAKARVIGVTCDSRSALKDFADVAIVLAVGPEVIAGSTRLKAGTATKIVLNMLTTAAMVRAGKTYGNLMVDVKSNSDKLRDRARRIIGGVTGLDYDAADALLQQAQWNVKAAILMQQTGATRATGVVTAAGGTPAAEASRRPVNPESLRRFGCS